MDTNCLLTKLKGTVNNNDLPELNTVYLDYIYNGDSSSYNICIMSGDNEIDLTFNPNLNIRAGGNTVSPLVTTYKLQPNSKMVFNTNGSEKPTYDITDAIKLQGIGVYGVTRIMPYKYGYFNKDVFNKTHSNYSSLYDVNQNLEMIIVPYDKIDSLSNTTKYIFAMVETGNEELKNIFGRNIQELHVNVVRVGGSDIAPYITLDSSSSMDTVLRVFDGRFVGDIQNLPLQIRYAGGYPSSLCNGELLNYVAKCRNNGRSEGWIRVPYVKSSSWGVTYDGTLLKDCDIPVASGTNASFLHWTSTNTYWETTPTGSDPYTNYTKSPFAWTPYV